MSSLLRLMGDRQKVGNEILQKKRLGAMAA